MSLNTKKKAIEAFHKQQFNEAEKLLTELCGLDSSDVESYFLLGIVFGVQEKHQKSEKMFRHVVRLMPGNPDALNNLGLSLEGQGRSEEAVTNFRMALQLNPDSADFHYNLANSFESLSCYDEAIEHYQKATILQPENPDIYANLGHALQKCGKLDVAIDAYQQALTINPMHAAAYNNLGTALKKNRELNKAIETYKKALEINPAYIEAHHNLGLAYAAKGKIADALESYQKTIELKPLKDHYNSSLLFTLNYYLNVSQEELYQEHLNYEKRYAAQLYQNRKLLINNCTEKRKLKIGYVSPDLRTHSVAYFFEPVLGSHNREEFEIYCYSNASKPDEMTERLREKSDYWRDIAHQSDEDVAELIQSDSIDILVDLAGHTAHNRLLVFARKPAPIQVTYLGYPNTTGLDCIDYRLTDAWADPDGQEQFHSEALVRLKHGFLCYRPPDDSLTVSSLPMATTGFVTFGSFNNLSKMVPEVIALWSKLLLAVPGSRLVVKNKSLQDKSVCEYFLSQFEFYGVSPESVELIGWLPSTEDHLKLYGQIDICLDTFPYCGTTTTCEALWMGVPVITLCGDRHASRVGNSLLNQVGLKKLVAYSEDEYIEIAQQLVNDMAGLQESRSEMRSRMLNSPLMDTALFAKNIEKAYSDMWDSWCTQQQDK